MDFSNFPQIKLIFYRYDVSQNKNAIIKNETTPEINIFIIIFQSPFLQNIRLEIQVNNPQEFPSVS